MAGETILVALLALTIGAAFCFGGYKWFMILLPIWGFIFGFALGTDLVSGVYGQSIFSLLVIIVAGIIVGLMIAIAAYLFFDFAVIILSATVGYSLGAGLAIGIGLGSWQVPAFVGILLAATAALLAIRLHLPKYIIIVFATLLGSSAIINGLLILAGMESLGALRHGVFEPITSHPAGFVLNLVLAGAGLLIQLRNSGDFELDLPRD